MRLGEAVLPRAIRRRAEPVLRTAALASYMPPRGAPQRVARFEKGPPAEPARQAARTMDLSPLPRAQAYLATLFADKPTAAPRNTTVRRPSRPEGFAGAAGISLLPVVPSPSHRMPQVSKGPQREADCHQNDPDGPQGR